MKIGKQSSCDLKFSFYEKATKINVKTIRRMTQIFMAFSEELNFTWPIKSKDFKLLAYFLAGVNRTFQNRLSKSQVTLKQEPGIYIPLCLHILEIMYDFVRN